MPIFILLATVAVGCAAPLFAWAIWGPRLYRDRNAQENLSRGLTVTAEPEAERGQLIAALGRRLTPASFVARLDRLLALAGRPAGWPMKRLLAAKFVLAVTGAAVGLLFLLGDPGMARLLLALGLMLLAYFVPDLLLYSRGIERQEAITLALPDTLDQMTIAVEAGLGFEAAMARAGQNGKGPLAQELVHTLQDMQVGKSRREAYQDLAARTTAVDLRRFVRSIIQADMYGISVAGVLRTQAAEMRMKRRQRAEEQAMKIPVKVLFPLMVCIMPVLFIVILGPAIINIVQTLSG
ncbi:type II secretion system F family protein [Paenarthrobacter sp. DKR-5]|uniref:type II secretion system F family protein n=1 Tax=Paenarthrobacter sp. DKR-5 TaxID=2835535 RepID=UPI001BDC15F1|nr:type II secretion system F family protein [Paenarthrobacter sp. DKR-5]MBT1001581.1 type II secretion system F family protein [Paenarthrobacter sp. DKR-5]